jgi:hypothetical protein
MIKDFDCCLKALQWLESMIEADGKTGPVPSDVDHEEAFAEAEDLPLCGKCDLCEEARREDESWRREIAMEAGMLHGVSAYNEAMGWEPE